MTTPPQYASVLGTHQPLSSEQVAPLRAGVIPMRVPVQEGLNNVFTGPNTLAVNPGFQLWHPAANAADVYVINVTAAVIVFTAFTAGAMQLQLQFTSTDGTGGGTGVQNHMSPGGPASGCTFRENPTTLGAIVGNPFCTVPVLRGASPVTPVPMILPLFQASNLEDSIVIPGGQAQGLSGAMNQQVAGVAGAYEISWIVQWIEL